MTTILCNSSAGLFRHPPVLTCYAGTASEYALLRLASQWGWQWHGQEQEQKQEQEQEQKQEQEQAE